MGDPSRPGTQLRIIFSAPADDGVAIAVAQDPRVTVEEHDVLPPHELVAAARRADVLVPRSFQDIDRELLAAGGAGALRMVVQASAGLDNIDLDAAEELGVEIIPIDPGNAVAVAELTLLSLLALLRDIRAHWSASQRGHWPVRDALQDRELRGRRLAIVGLGRCGGQVARRALAFGMEVVAFDPYVPVRRFEQAGVARAATVDELLRTADALTLHCPLTEETRGMIAAQQLARLPRGAVLINAARGGIVDETDLCAALDEGHIAGAALDVYTQEPPSVESLVSHPRVLATPHLGGHTVESHRARGENLISALRQIIGRICR